MGAGLLLAAALVSSCETTRLKKPPTYGGGAVSEGVYEKGGSNLLPFLITEVSTDETYGFSSANPVRVGGGTSAGLRNQQRYLRALLGPKGEPIVYERQGSCCGFPIQNGSVVGTGQLDVYAVTWKGRATPLKLYLNMYEDAPLQAPVGFTAVR